MAYEFRNPAVKLSFLNMITIKLGGTTRQKLVTDRQTIDPEVRHNHFAPDPISEVKL